MGISKTSYKNGHKKKGGRKKGIPNRKTRLAIELVEKFNSFITDEDLYSLYKKMIKRPALYIQYLRVIAPKDWNVNLMADIKANINPFDGVSKETKEKMIELIEKENDAVINE